MNIPTFVNEAFAKEAAELDYTVESVRKSLENLPTHATELEHKLRAVYETWLKKEEEEAEYARFCTGMLRNENNSVDAAKALLEMAEKRLGRFPGGDTARLAHIARIKRWLKEHQEKDSTREVQDIRKQFEKECARHSRHYSTIVKATRWLDVAKDFFKVSEVLVQKYPTCPESLRFREEMKDHVKTLTENLVILRKEDELLAASCKVKFLSSKLEEDKKAYDEAYEKKETTTMELHKAREEAQTLEKQLEELKK